MAQTLKLDQLRPLLRPCEIYEGDRNLVIENALTKAQVVLPRENHRILDLLDGSNTIKDISSALYHSEGKVSFHSIITTVKLLKEADLLDGVNHEFNEVHEDKAPHEQKASILNRTLMEITLAGQVRIPFQSDWTFWIMAMVLIALVPLGIDNYLQMKPGLFLKSRTGYSEALFRLFIFSSLLLSLKAICQGLLLLISAKMFYRLHLKLYPYAVALGINDNSIYSHPRKSVIIGYGVISSLLYLIFGSVLPLIPFLARYRHDLTVLSVLLTFMEMNPYRRSDLTKLFYFFYAENQMRNIMPYLKNCTLAGLWRDTGAKLSDEVRYIIYSVLAIVWAIAFSLFSAEVVLKSFPSLFYQVQFGSPASKYSALVVMGALLFITGYLLVDLFHTILRNIISPILGPLMKLGKRARVVAAVEVDQESLFQDLKRNMLFNQLTDDTLEYIISLAPVKKLKKDSTLILQGDESGDVYFLISGSVDVTVTEGTGREKHIVTLGPKSLIGEMSILQDGRRSANVRAREEIVFLEMPASIFQEMNEHPDYGNDFEKLKKRIEISQFVSSANLFKDFPPEIMNLFVEAGDLVLFPAGHNIVDEGEKDKTFYLLLKGRVEVFKGADKLAELNQGDFFGEVALIADVPRTATVRTLEDCLFLYIEDKKFWKILSENVELAMYIESVGRHRMEDAA